LLKGPSSLGYAPGISPRTFYLLPECLIVLTLGSNPSFSVAGRRALLSVFLSFAGQKKKQPGGCFLLFGGIRPRRSASAESFCGRSA
ncbi:MAG: hypothetical protein II789_07630, partial [Clostridia bacterium]|nr:hypothetical protein [Clostridia bacterium]